jgi:hypothetical protein
MTSSQHSRGIPKHPRVRTRSCLNPGAPYNGVNHPLEQFNLLLLQTAGFCHCHIVSERVLDAPVRFPIALQAHECDGEEEEGVG